MKCFFLVPVFRARYYQEKREGLYGGAMFITSYAMLSLPLSFLTTIMSVGILVPVVDLGSWVKASAVLWASFVASEQVTVATLMVVKRPLRAGIAVLYITLCTLVIASGSMRSLRYVIFRKEGKVDKLIIYERKMVKVY